MKNVDTSQYNSFRTRVVTHGLPSGQGPAVIGVEMQNLNVGPMEIEGWIGNFGSSNVWIFEGTVSLADAQAKVARAQAEKVDCIIALTEAGPVSCGIEENARRITIFFESANNVGQTESVSLKITEYFNA